MTKLFDIKVTGQRQLIQVNSQAIRRLKNKRVFFLAAVIVLEQWVKRNFQNEGKLHDNSRYHWEPLADSTIAGRRKGGGGGRPRILRDTGALFGRWSRTANNRDGVLKSGVNYSASHENGNARKRLPQRKIFPSDKQLGKIIQPVLAKFMNKTIG